MKKIKIGVIGAGRGKTMMKYCNVAENAELVAVCDKWIDGLKLAKQHIGENVALYTDYDEFLKHDMDAVVLANYATEHAPFAIKAMKAGKHVISEVLPVQTLKEAVELCEAVEETGMTYAYAENYCFMAAPMEMRKLYKEGKLGTFEYGEGEYLHNCEPIWPEITRGEPDHWRNLMSAFYYCTHSAGPLIHITGMRPVSVSGFETDRNARARRIGSLAGGYAVEMVTLENGALFKSIHGVSPSRNSIWYSVYGSKGRLESAREDAKNGYVHTLYSFLDKNEGDNDNSTLTCYKPEGPQHEKATAFGHGGSDFYTMYNFCEYLRGDKNADIIDVYEALDMGFVGLFAQRSAMAGGMPMEIPDFRDKDAREKYRNDTACCDPKVAGDQLLPSCSKSNEPIDMKVYEDCRKKWEAQLAAKLNK